MATGPLVLARRALLANGLNAKGLAERLGYDDQYVRNVLSGSAESRVARRRIEDFLGVPIWGTLAEFTARQQSKT
jgi:transcriptional regulator with XRE-family HTH domain